MLFLVVFIYELAAGSIPSTLSTDILGFCGSKDEIAANFLKKENKQIIMEI